MEIFYKDKTKIFECRIFVEGADMSQTSARLVLKFPDSKASYLYYGKINEDNICTVEVPALKEIKASKGQAILEVIADTTFFESWSGDIELKQSKTVTVEMIVPKDKPKLNESPKIKVEIKEEEKKPETKSNLSTKEKLLKLFKENNSKKIEKGYSPSKDAIAIVSTYPRNLLTEADKINFKYFLDKISTTKLKRLRKVIS